MSRLRLAALAALLLALAAPLPATARTPSDWSEDQGAATAGRMIDACLTSGPKARDRNLGCVDPAFEPCADENGGTLSQYDLNVCRRFSYEAWQARYDALLARFDALFRTWTTSRDDWKRTAARRFPSQEADWRRWAAADCEVREAGSVGGTIHSYAVASCRQRYIALRTIELTPVLEWWETR